jgi:hypothetical protein
MNLNPKNKSAGNDAICTPKWVAQDMVNHFKPSGRVLDPCRGNGVFSNLILGCLWCEIKEDVDFFDWKKPVDYIISNPPFSAMRKFIIHSFSVSDNVIFLVPVWKIYLPYSVVMKARGYGHMKEIRWYGTGSKLGFPMGNGIGAVHWEKGYKGPIHQTYHD